MQNQGVPCEFTVSETYFTVHYEVAIVLYLVYCSLDSVVWCETHE